jgi:hypothetical protein
VKGDVIILNEPLPVPDGTEVKSSCPQPKTEGGKGGASVAQATFGMIPSDPAIVRAVLEEDVYET